MFEQTRTSSTRNWPRQLAFAVVGALALLAAGATSTIAQSTDNYVTVGTIAAYLGVVPAGIVAEHPAGHPEQAMHGGAPLGAHVQHIVIALFDAPTGQRIENAKVDASVSGPGHIGTRVALEPMLIEGVITYGGFAAMAGAGQYNIDLTVKRPGDTNATKISFVYDHEPN